MRLLAVVLLLCAVVFGAPKTPLGSYARTGVPVVFTSDRPVAVDLSGWAWRVEGTTALFAPRLPCTVVFGDDSFALRAVPEGKLLLGVLGPGQLPVTATTLVEHIELVEGTPWQALDLFDRIVWTGIDRPTAVQYALLLRWVRMGGDLVVPRGIFDVTDVGLGRLQSVGGQNDALPARAHPIPRLGNVLPEIYDLAPARGVGSPALDQLRLVFFGMALVLLLGLLGGAGGWIGRRVFFSLTLAVVLTAAGLGTWLTRQSFEPVAEAILEVTYFSAEKSEYSRARVFRIFRATGDGATLPSQDGAPLFYRAAGDPWWTELDGAIAFDEGVSRAFMVDLAVVGAVAGAPGGEDARELRRLMRRVAPPGAKTGWQWGKRVLRPLGTAAENKRKY